MSTNAPGTEQLLAAARAGKDSALAQLFEKHRGRLERIARLRLDRRLQSRIDPADIVQDTYLAVQRKFLRFYDPEDLDFFLWLRLELAQRLVDVHRFHLGAQARDAALDVSLQQGALPQVTSMSLAEQLLGRLTTPSNAAMRAELKLRLEDAINSLDPQDRDILVMRHFEELTNAEAAQVLGIKSSAACNRYVRAIRRLKTALGGPLSSE